MAVEWGYFNKFHDIIHKYMQVTGEGDTMTSQIVTAVNKLIYKYYNDGDFYDNTHVDSMGNDLSSYANWLSKHAEGSEEILSNIFNVDTEGQYEDILKELADLLLSESYLEKYQVPRTSDSIYDCKGAYKFIDYDYDYDYYDYDDNDDYEEDYDEDNDNYDFD